MVPLLRGLGHTFDAAEITALIDGVFEAELVSTATSASRCRRATPWPSRCGNGCRSPMADTILDEVGQPVDLFPTAGRRPRRSS